METAIQCTATVWHCSVSTLSFNAAAAAASLQSCPTLCDPIDGSPPGSPIPGILQAEHWSGLPFPSPMHESEKSWLKTQRVDFGKDSDAGRDWGQEEKGTTEDEMAGWHH